MDDFALFDFTPNYCPDCGAQLKLSGPPWADYRSGIKHICPTCQLVFYFVKDLESVLRRFQDRTLTVFPYSNRFEEDPDEKES